ncbi:Peroxisomal acyl-coenzyme A oxidase 1 [Oopsacas minuta]|uniref:Acyl-coenzyme A oxidase n=1 Tax=Oopsacas minuta TaxID=111878 RepID=A0AAV7KKA0_9METZ|nr:Peroxisomal acyl-coenzyme A oxidase 1 [Oopsacas minuta]KAI6661268.1 Peroxisomal acyl-coenzyme A oxidase 1 [Oopsacas minuta]
MELLASERKASRLDTEQITNLIYGGREMVKRKREIENAVASDPNLDNSYYHYQTTEERFSEAVRKFTYSITKKMPQLKISGPVESHLFRRAVESTNPYALQIIMFIPTIRGQCTQEQKDKWLPLALNYDILGCYAQTEMGHGTFVRGLETTATYDPERQEFDIHSPTLTSTKWWPGGMGVIATHAIVPARLITKGEDKGIHNFIVQLRSLENHKALNGITIGDIGPKFGYDEADNGYLRFDHVRIPRDNLLMRYSQVLPDGTYVHPKSEKLSYGTMVYVRSTLAYSSFDWLSRAVTIAIRYSIVRRQTQNKPGELETQLLDYVNQQYTLIPLLSSAYALYFISQYMLRLYTKSQSHLAQDNIESLPELHATSSGVKSIATSMALKGIESCRLSCGGHGYSLSSGFPYIFYQAAPSVTYEGDNTVLLLQTAHYLVKMRQRVLENPNTSLPDNLTYLSNQRGYSRPISLDFLSTRDQLIMYEGMARSSVDRALAKLRDGARKGNDRFDARNGAAIELTQCAEAHTYYVIVKSFIESVEGREVRSMISHNQTILQSLSNVFSLHYMLSRSGSFLECGVLHSTDLVELRRVLMSLLEQVRPEAVALVDAFDIPDIILRSVLGRKDGDVYRAMWEWVELNPRNKHRFGVHPVYRKYTKQLLKSSL